MRGTNLIADHMTYGRTFEDFALRKLTELIMNNPLGDCPLMMNNTTCDAGDSCKYSHSPTNEIRIKLEILRYVLFDSTDLFFIICLFFVVSLKICYSAYECLFVQHFIIILNNTQLLLFTFSITLRFDFHYPAL